MEMQIFVVDRESPVHLRRGRGTEKVAYIIFEAERPLEPRLVELGAVYIPGLDDIPCIVQRLAQLGILRQNGRKGLQHHGTDGFIGMRTAVANRIL